MAYLHLTVGHLHPTDLLQTESVVGLGHGIHDAADLRNIIILNRDTAYTDVTMFNRRARSSLIAGSVIVAYESGIDGHVVVDAGDAE